MANNPGNNRSSIEFVVKPRKDLFLEGVLRKIPRVTKGLIIFFTINQIINLMLF